MSIIIIDKCVFYGYNYIEKCIKYKCIFIEKCNFIVKNHLKSGVNLCCTEKLKHILKNT